MYLSICHSLLDLSTVYGSQDLTLVNLCWKGLGKYDAARYHVSLICARFACDHRDVVRGGLRVCCDRRALRAHRQQIDDIVHNICTNIQAEVIQLQAALSTGEAIVEKTFQRSQNV